MTRFKELKWEYNEYRTSLIAKVKILNNEYLAFQLTNIDTDDVILIDGQKMPEDDKYYNHVGTVKKGKEMAQALFELYCSNIIINICK